MSNERSEMWREIKEGIGVSIKIMAYTILGLGTAFAIGCVYVACCQ